MHITSIISSIIIISVLILTGFITIYLINCQKNENFINYKVNDKYFKVIESIANHDDAAEILYKIDNNLTKLIQFIDLKHSNLNVNNIKDNSGSNSESNSGMVIEKENFIKEIIRKLNNNYKSDSLQENIPKVPMQDVSYNINKGELMSICIRKYEDIYKFHNTNDILFVSIHELAHSCNTSYGHDKKFWKIFRFLLENAIEMKIFKNINYNKYPVKYCSMYITYNPIFDKTLDDKYYFKYS